MVTGIIPIWVKYYADDIIKLNQANVLDSCNEKYHKYDHEFGKYISNDQAEKKAWDFLYNNCRMFFFVGSHFMAINYVKDEESAGFFPTIC